MATIRIVKAVLAASAALYALLAGLDNLTDYSSNFPFVQHVLEMDTTFRHPSVMWRSINAPLAHHAAFILIIAAELAVGVIAGVGAYRMFATRRDHQEFVAAKSVAAVGLLLGVMLWFGGFLVIAGEWFLMWQSAQYNAQQPAFQYSVAFLLVLLIVLIPEEHGTGGKPNSSNL